MKLQIICYAKKLLFGVAKFSVFHLRAISNSSTLCVFFVSGDVGNYYYGQGHPMKPHRIRMTHNLLLNYGLYRKMEIYVC